MILIPSLVGIALLDSLNPSLFIAQFYLFTTPKPTPRIVSYICGVLVANFVGGVLFLTGFGAVIGNLIGQTPPLWGAGLQVALGGGLILFGLLHKAKVQAEAEPTRKPRTAGLLAAFGFGIVVMAQELTTALPYFVAIERIVDARLSPVGNLLALGLYNLIFALPLFGFLGLFMRFRQRFTTQITRISQWIRVWTPRVMRGAALIFGGFLVVNGVGYFVGG